MLFALHDLAFSHVMAEHIEWLIPFWLMSLASVSAQSSWFNTAFAIILWACYPWQTQNAMFLRLVHGQPSQDAHLG